MTYKTILEYYVKNQYDLDFTLDLLTFLKTVSELKKLMIGMKSIL